MANLILGDCLEKLKTMPDSCMDSVVTDPPYGLNFMNKKWDYDVPSVEIWREVLRVLKPGGHLLSFGGTRTYHRMVVNIEDAGFEIRDQIMWLYGSGFPKSHNIGDGIGTALKPANEPIVVARKPLEKGLTVAANVLKWGTGGLNVDVSRIGTERVESGRGGRGATDSVYKDGLKPQTERTFVEGRWPANLLLDEAAAEALDAQAGNVSKFFYQAKASKRERGEGNIHPTVKPLKLMEYLIKLVTPPKGTVLDPFMGSGSTGVAAIACGSTFFGVEMNPEYYEIALSRLKGA